MLKRINEADRDGGDPGRYVMGKISQSGYSISRKKISMLKGKFV